MKMIQAVLSLAAMFAIAAVVLGCNSLSKPPTPTLVGPDTGWTNVPTVFQATHTAQSSDGITKVADFDWGDHSSNGGYDLGEPFTHAYTVPGVYVVRCRIEYMRQHLDWFTADTRYGDWSNPCTVAIVQSK